MPDTVVRQLTPMRISMVFMIIGRRCQLTVAAIRLSQFLQRRFDPVNCGRLGRLNRLQFPQRLRITLPDGDAALRQ